MILKIVHVSKAGFDAIRYKYQDIKAAELDADMTQRLVNGLFLQKIGVNANTGEPLDVDAREYLAKRKGDDEDPLGGIANL